jgi:hypothetical protein
VTRLEVVETPRPMHRDPRNLAATTRAKRPRVSGRRCLAVAILQQVHFGQCTLSCVLFEDASARITRKRQHAVLPIEKMPMLADGDYVCINWAES